MTKTVEQRWLKPKDIADRGLILDSKGNGSYRHVLRLINSGRLKARVWTQQGLGGDKKKDYFMVNVDEIERYNRELYFGEEGGE